MKKHPIRVPRDYYRGRDARRLRKQEEFNRVALLVKTYINAMVDRWPEDTVAAIMSYEDASAIGADSDLVHRVILGIDGGSNGITIYKGDYDRALANPGASE